MRKSIPLASKSDPARTRGVSDERLVNMFAERVISPAADGGFTLYRTPGLVAFAEPADSPCRGMIAVGDDVLLSVHSQGLYSTNSDGATTRIGTIPGVDKVIMASNDARVDSVSKPQVAIVTELATYIYQDGALSALAFPDDEIPNSVEYIDGYFIFSITDGRFFWSGINDGVSVDALDFATAEGDPDGLLRVIEVNRELFLMGPRSIEVWHNTGDATATFQRLPGAVVSIGLLTKMAACKLSGRLYFIDQHRMVRRTAQGYQSERISNHGVEKALADLADVSDLEMWGYVEQGHEFIVVACTGFTWVFDASINQWHERESYSYSRWQARYYARQFGKHLVGGAYSGKLYELDNDAATEDGEQCVTIIRLPVVSGFPDRGVIDRLDINMETGVGLSPAAPDRDENPEIMLRFSIDGGKTWKGGLRRALGAMSKSRTSISFTRLGQMDVQGVTFELSCSAAVVNAIYGAFLTARRRG